MPAIIEESLRKKILDFLAENRKSGLIECYLFYLEEKLGIHPVLFPRKKMVYLGLGSLIAKLEQANDLWRETEIKIQFGEQRVNEETKKIYICPFTGKAFGDNTCPNPQDAIYDWVSKCPENTERIGGLKAKRFFVSEDPEIIKNYITKRKEPITKIVYSSAITGKLFNSKESVMEDFKKHQIKEISLCEVQNQNRYEIEEELLHFLEEELSEDKVGDFVNTLSKYEEFEPYLSRWLE